MDKSVILETLPWTGETSVAPAVTVLPKMIRQIKTDSMVFIYFIQSPPFKRLIVRLVVDIAEQYNKYYYSRIKLQATWESPPLFRM